MNLKELYHQCVTLEKQKTDRIIPWLYYVIRPLSIAITKPLLWTSVTPVAVTLVSMMATVAGFALVGFGQNVSYRVIGWLGFFVWAVLDCVDGNIARCKGLASDRGALWDATGGYMALSLIFFASGIAAYYDHSIIEICDNALYIVFGGMASLLSLFPRLIMQKKKALEPGAEAVKAVGDKNSFNLSKIIALNIESAIGFMQVVLLLAIIFHFLNLFALFYMLFNLLMTVYSLYQLLRA